MTRPGHDTGQHTTQPPWRWYTGLPAILAVMILGVACDFPAWWWVLFTAAIVALFLACIDPKDHP